MEMLPEPAWTVITCWDTELVGTVTTGASPESVLALTWYRVLPAGSTSVTFPEPLSTRTCAGTPVKVRVMSPDPVLATTLAPVRPATETLPEPVLSVTLGPDRVPPEMSPDPVRTVRALGMFSARMLPEPVPALTGLDRPCSVTSPEPVEMSARLPSGTTARKSKEHTPVTNRHRGGTATPDEVRCQVTVDRTSEKCAVPGSRSSLPAAWVTCRS